MNFLLRPYKFSKYCIPGTCTEDSLEYAIANPQIVQDKDHMPLAIYGSLVDSPELDEESGHPRVIGANMLSLDAIQLDYDGGKTMDEFAAEYQGNRWFMYTSYSHGFKGDNQRFRVVMPLASPMPCRLLSSKRVRKNLDFNFPGCDRSAWDMGHWQLGPCIRSADAPYVYRSNKGEPWGGDDYWRSYEDMMRAELEEMEERRNSYANRERDVDESRLLVELDAELAIVPVNEGVRHDSAKRLLAKYAHMGIAHLLPSVPCPWTEPGWETEWANLTDWASRIC